MIRIFSFIITFMLFLSTSSQACMYGAQGGPDLYQVFNRMFFDYNESAAFNSDIELLNSSYFISDDSRDQVWGQKGQVFNVDLTYTSGGSRQSLGYMESGSYHELLGASDIGRHGYEVQTDATITVESNDGFMWVDAASRNGWGTKIFSDPDFNYGEKDLFLAFAITDGDMLDHVCDRFGLETFDDLDRVWLIAFDGIDRRNGNFTDLVALVHDPLGNQNPLPTPVPASLLLLASGCTGLFLKRRKA